MDRNPEILCIGSILWDIIGRANYIMNEGSDVPGKIKRLPGGVALNIAMTLCQFGFKPALLSVVGRDQQGAELIKAIEKLNLITRYLHRSKSLPTDQYMAIEGMNGLIAAIADAHSLETAGNQILKPLSNGELGSLSKPFSGLIALDGNLTLELLNEISVSDLFSKCDLRIAPASPGKAERLLPFLMHSRATLYVNVKEAEYLCKKQFNDAAEAASSLVANGAYRAVVTNGPMAAALVDNEASFSAKPPKVDAVRVTGAGDIFMAAHIASELNGIFGLDALQFAANKAGDYVSGVLEVLNEN